MEKIGLNTIANSKAGNPKEGNKRTCGAQGTSLNTWKAIGKRGNSPIGKRGKK